MIFSTSTLVSPRDSHIMPDSEAIGKYGFLGQIRIFELRANSQHLLLDIIGHAKTNILQ